MSWFTSGFVDSIVRAFFYIIHSDSVVAYSAKGDCWNICPTYIVYWYEAFFQIFHNAVKDIQTFAWYINCLVWNELF